MEVTEIKAKMASSIVPDTTQEAPKKAKKANTEKPEARPADRIPEAKEVAIRKLTEHINQMMKEMDFSLQFIPGGEGEQVVIKVLDGDGKVIRQIPPEELDTLSSNIGEQIGLLLNAKL